MKLLVVTQYYWPEPFRITDICEQLVARGHEVDVLTSVPNVPQGEFYDGYGWFKRGEKEHGGVRIERVNVIRRGRDSAVRLALNCASYALNALFHLPGLGKNGYDAVFVFNNSPVSTIFPAKVFARRHKIPYVVFVLDIWPDSMYLLLDMPITAKQTLFRRISLAVSRWLYRGAEALLISSKGMEPKLRGMGLQNVIEYFPNYAEPTRRAVLGQGVETGQGAETKQDAETGQDTASKSVTRAELGLAETDLVIGFAGNVGVAQGLDKVVEAAARLCGCAADGIIFDGTLHDEIAGDTGSHTETGQDSAMEKITRAAENAQAKAAREPQTEKPASGAGSVQETSSWEIAACRSGGEMRAGAEKSGPGADLKFLIVGDGPELHKLRALCDARGVADWFVFTGWVDGSAVAGYMALCDVTLACLKDNEVLNLTLPAKVQTYMDAGKPVLAFMNGAGADTVRAAGCGFTAEAESVDSLCAALGQIGKTERAALREMGESGRAYCAAHFDREKILDCLERYLAEAAERAQAKRAG